MSAPQPPCSQVSALPHPLLAGPELSRSQACPHPPPPGFLVLHVEPTQGPQVDLEQLVAGECPSHALARPLPHSPQPVWLPGTC